MAATNTPRCSLALRIAGLVREALAATEQRSSHPLRPGRCRRTWERRAGDCKDQVALTVKLLHEANLPAYPALLDLRPGLPLRRRLPTRLPTPYEFNHVVVYVPLARRELWLDLTGRPEDYHRAARPLQALILAPGRYRLRAVGPVRFG